MTNRKNVETVKRDQKIKGEKPGRRKEGSKGKKRCFTHESCHQDTRFKEFLQSPQKVG